MILVGMHQLLSIIYFLFENFSKSSNIQPIEPKMNFDSESLYRTFFFFYANVLYMKKKKGGGF